MLEQGAHEEDLHRQVGAYAADSAADILIAVGRASEKMAEEASARGMRDVRWCPDHESAMAELEQLAGGDRAFLFKASRGMHLEKLYAYTKALLEGTDS
jgi:UDP-N-acetylmuramoyl-tripeptide--D-alanyl-D-alanine ligase